MKKSYFLALAFFFSILSFSQNTDHNHSHEGFAVKAFGDHLLSEKMEEFATRNNISDPESFFFFTATNTPPVAEIISIYGSVDNYLTQKGASIKEAFELDREARASAERLGNEPWVSPLACGSPCTNPGFESGDFTAWEAKEGNASTGANPTWTATNFNQVSVVAAGFDPLVPVLPMVDPGGGGGFAARVGDLTWGARAAQLSMSFTVSAANTNFTYRYAVVLEDPVSGHTQAQSPYFRLQLRNQSGTVVNCGSYQEFGGTGMSGYTRYGSTNYWYRNWTTVFVDLTPYIGQCVTLEFVTQDCTQSGHLGYAYVDASCSPSQIITSSPAVCGSNQVTLNAPAGATTYAWTGPGIVGPSNTQTITVNQGGTYQVTMGSLSGCPTILNITLGSAPASPTASFSSGTVCVGQPTVFTDLSTPTGGVIDEYYWDWNNDGVVDDSLPNQSHTFATAGSFPVNLQVQWGQCWHDTTITVTVVAGSVAAFSSTPVCLNTATTFTNTSTGTPLLWNFDEPSSGAANTSTAASPTHTYSTPGSYSVQLIVGTGQCSDTAVTTIVVNPNPVSLFTSTTVCEGVNTSFTDQSTVGNSNTISQWAWNFDDIPSGVNNTSTVQNPVHLFSTPGTYNVGLTVTTNNSCQHSSTVAVTVKPQPTAVFTSGNVCFNTATTFNNTSTQASGYIWDFGEPSSGVNNTSTATSPSHTYSSAGTFTIQLVAAEATGQCNDTVSTTVVVNPLPAADFEADSVCEGATTYFFDLSTVTNNNTITGWSWNFGDPGSGANNISTNQNSTHDYSVFGNYNVVLTVTTNNNCQSSTTLPVTVKPEPAAVFASGNVCHNTATSFTNTSTQTTSYFWDFGDPASGTSNNATSASPTHTYVSSGTFDVTYVAINGTCFDTATTQVTVYPMPVSSFTADTICFGQTTTFSDLSTIGTPDQISSWSFDFGDGSPLDTNQNPTHNYALAGTYNASLTVTSNNNCSTTLSVPVIVNVQPIAGFVTSNVCIYNSAVMTDQSTDAVTVMWNYGDSPLIDTVVGNPTHIYPLDGTYVITQIVSTPEGCWDTLSAQVVIHPVPEPAFSVSGVCLNNTSVFTETSSINSGTITNWSWDFGDGSPVDNNQNPTHVYAAPGDYDVELILTSDNNCKDTLTIIAPVYPLPTAGFIAPDVCLNNQSAFTDQSVVSTGNVTGWQWDFDDASTSAAQNPSHLYSSDGTYNVTLIVTTNHSCTDTIIRPVTVDALPVVQFTSDVTSGCSVLCVNFSDQSTVTNSTITGWSWNFGEGTTDNIDDPSNCFEDAMSYNITLTTVSADGCSSTLTIPQMITVWPLPVAGYVAVPQPTTILNTAVTFVDQSSGASQWFWDFGDGSSQAGMDNNPTHLYPDSGANAYLSSLIVLNQYGCSDTAYVPVEIGPDFTFFAPNAFTPNADGKNDGFRGMGVGIDVYQMWVYDRWGNMLWTSTDQNEFWPGKVQGSDTMCQQDVYVWVVRLTDVFGKKHKFMGHVTLIK